MWTLTLHALFNKNFEWKRENKNTIKEKQSLVYSLTTTFFLFIIWFQLKFVKFYLLVLQYLKKYRFYNRNTWNEFHKTQSLNTLSFLYIETLQVFHFRVLKDISFIDGYDLPRKLTIMCFGRESFYRHAEIYWKKCFLL